MKSVALQLVFTFIFMAGFSGYGQDLQYRFTRLGVSHGLSNSQINCIFKDSKGFMWFGTMSGLNRFDGYTFKVFRNDLHDSLSLKDNYVLEIFEDYKGLLWVTTQTGMNIYDPATESFHHNIRMETCDMGNCYLSVSKMIKDSRGFFWILGTDPIVYKFNPANKTCRRVDYLPSDTMKMASNRAVSLVEGKDDKIWMITANGILIQIDNQTESIIYSNYFLYENNENASNNYSLFSDNDNDLWVSVTNNARGVFYFDSRKSEVRPINMSSYPLRLNNNIIKGVTQDNNGFIWIATDHGGINIIDKNKQTIMYLLHNPDNDKSISQNSINTIYKDNTGIIWIGTFKQGINYYHEDIVRFNSYRHVPSDPYSLGFDDIHCFAEDNSGNLWIGTNGGGLDYFDRKTGKYTHYRHQPDNPNSLSNDVIVDLHVDHKNNLWIGTFYGGLDFFDGKNFKHYQHNPSNQRSISDNRVWSVYEDSEFNLWIGTLGGGLDLYDREKDVFYHYKAGQVNSVQSNFIISIIEDREGNIWVGTAEGLDVLEKQTGRFSHFGHEEGNPKSLSNNITTALLEDSRGNIWIGTREGLNRFNKNNRDFEVFYKSKNGLPDNSIMAILEDNLGNLWISTINGICNMVFVNPGTDKESYLFRNYDETDGLQGREFNVNSAVRTNRGELIFAGSNGYNFFYPELIKENRRIPEVIITDFKIMNESVKVNQKLHGRVVLKKSINVTKEITLRYVENMFSIEFTAFNYFHPEKNLFKYKLEGFNNDWIYTDGKVRKATYTNLDPGKYIFRVLASNNDGYWNEEGTTLIIRIKPPFWRTNFAIFIYVVMLTGILFLLRYSVIERERMRYRVEHDRREAERQHELDQQKLKIITNISHEFKTPLTLILAAIENAQKDKKGQNQKVNHQVIHRNAKRLLTLVNQLLDFRKLSAKSIELNLSIGDIVQFIKDVSESFTDLAEKKDISFRIKTNIEELYTFFDHDKIEKIIFNLLSNAYKFTPDKGTVEINLTALSDPEGNYTDEVKEIKWLEIRVKDSGLGIAPDKHEKIFEEFVQLDHTGSVMNHGTGIGLAMVKEYVTLHGGSIRVESSPGQGSCFILLIPVTKSLAEDKSFSEIKNAVSVEQESDLQDIFQAKPTVLIVEDNEEFRSYLKGSLIRHYHILEAPNGKVAWKITLDNLPDLVVSDIMMPEMDGIELCKKIKSDRRTSQVPVILLTARSAVGQKIEGYETGADDYITKPFSFEVLESRIFNLIQHRRKLLETLRRQIEIKPSEIEITSVDEKLILKTLSIVEKNISNPDFSVEELSREVGMSRVHLYKKLVALTGKTPIEFIRTVRLKRAAQLLEKSQMSVAEIAYQTGFNNPKYFARYFKAEFNVLPSQYSDKKKKRDKS